MRKLCMSPSRCNWDLWQVLWVLLLQIHKFDCGRPDMDIDYGQILSIRPGGGLLLGSGSGPHMRNVRDHDGLRLREEHSQILPAASRAKISSMMEVNTTEWSKRDPMAFIEVVAPASTPGAPAIFLDGDELGSLVEKSSGEKEDTFTVEIDGFVGHANWFPKVFRLPPIKVSWPDGHPTQDWSFILRSGPRGKVAVGHGRLIDGKKKEQIDYKDTDGNIDGFVMEFKAEETQFELEEAVCIALNKDTTIGVDLATVLDSKPGTIAKDLDGRLMEQGIQELKKDKPLILYGASEGQPLVRKEAKPGQEYRWTADGVVWAESTNQFPKTNGPQEDVLISAANLEKIHNILGDAFSKEVGKFFVEEPIGEKHELLYTDLDYLLGRKQGSKRGSRAGARRNDGGIMFFAVIGMWSLSF